MKRVLLSAMVLMLAAMAFAAQPVSSTGTPVMTPAKSAGHQVIPVTPKAITWTTIDSISPAASRLTAAAFNGKIYRFSGNTPTGTSQPVVQELDPAVGTWVTKNALPFGIYNAPSATWRDRIILFSGQQLIAGVSNLMDSVVCYFPGGDSVQCIDGAPYRAGFASSAVIADTLYVFGGTTDYANGLTASYACDLTTMTWTAKTALPAAQYGAAAVASDGNIYIFGGRDAGVDQSSVLMYRPTAEYGGGSPWTTKTAMSTARGGLCATPIGQYAYVFGGGWGTFLNTVARYDPIADSVGGTPWTDETSMTFGRRTLGATALGNSAYVVGGYSGTFRACVEKGVVDAPVVQDVAMQQVGVMPYVGNYGALVHPSISVGNSTPFWQYNVPLTLQIDSAGITVYKHTLYYNLGAISGYNIPLPSWRPCTTPGIVYDLTAYNSLTSDQDQSNDTVRTTVTVKDAVWFQYDSATITGRTAQNFETANDMYDAWMADDFSIDGVDTVRIDSIAIRGSYSAGGGPADSLSLIITSDSSYYPAFSQTVASAMVLPANLGDNAGTFMARLTTPILLPAAERYWLIGQTFMNYTPNGQWYWTDYTGVLNYATTAAYFINPGDGFATGATSWTMSAAIWPGVYNFSFVLYGGQYLGVAGNPVTSQLRPDFRLAQVSPNPMRDNARFSFSLAKGGHAKLDVYSLTGQKVASLVDGYRASGRHDVSWNGRDQSGRKAASGMYFYRLTADGRALTRKFVVVK